MCYSAMVIQDVRKLSSLFGAKIETSLYLDLFDRRLKGEKLYINKAMELPFVLSPTSETEAEIADKITEWHKEEITRLEKDLFLQVKRLADAERILELKPTKKAETDRRVATTKIKKFKSDLEKHKTQKILSESEERIFPLHYLSMLCLNDKGERVIRPVRYLLRPSDKDESFDRKFNGCYNARLDNLDSVRWWREALGKRHGVMLVKKFYENVATPDYMKKNKLAQDMQEKENLVLAFEPDNTEYMFIPTLWDKWEKDGEPVLYSTALITDEPAPEISAAGHDRTPIFLKESAIDAWLSPKSQDIIELKKVLDQREFPHYTHQVLGA